MSLSPTPKELIWPHPECMKTCSELSTPRVLADMQHTFPSQDTCRYEPHFLHPGFMHTCSTFSTPGCIQTSITLSTPRMHADMHYTLYTQDACRHAAHFPHSGYMQGNNWSAFLNRNTFVQESNLLSSCSHSEKLSNYQSENPEVRLQTQGTNCYSSEIQATGLFSWMISAQKIFIQITEKNTAQMFLVPLTSYI